MRVLIACEYSGVSRRAFAALGHSVVSADFEPAEDGSPRHYRGDCFDLIDREPFDLMIAHPPCTFLSVSGLHWCAKDPARSAQMEEALSFVRRLMDAPIPRIAIENPVSAISTYIRKPDQIVHPWQFGDDASKTTCLWLKNLPLLEPTDVIEGELFCCGVRLLATSRLCPHCHGSKQAQFIYANQTATGQNRLPPSEGRWKERSRTFPGMAAAWAAQWGSLSLGPKRWGIPSR